MEGLEWIKISFTAAAFILSVLSFAIAYQTKRRTERDAFEDRKANIVNLMRKVDSATEALAHEAAWRQDELEKSASRTPYQDSNYSYLIGHLKDIQAIKHARGYTPEDVLALRNSAENHEKVRFLLSGEQALEIWISHGLYRQVMTEAIELTKKCEENKRA